MPDMAVADPEGAAAVAAAPSTSSPSGDLERCRSRLRRLAEREGLTLGDISHLLGPLAGEDEQAADFLLGDAPAAPRCAVRRVLERLEDQLGVDLDTEQLKGLSARIGRRAADAVGVGAGLLSGYIVIGGLIEGESLLLGDSIGPLGLLLFVVILSLLGLFEALHTSATMLKIADLGALAERYPGAAALHRNFRTDHGLARFLAGRQMVVVVTVFVCSPLSSFPELAHWPLTDAPLPDLMLPVVTLGLPGALFVLWFGQLVPQFLATRHAVRLTDTWLVGAAFKLAYALESLGFARPGFWGAAWDRSSDPIPSSAARRWEESTHEVVGYGIVGIVREWTMTRTGTEVRAAATTRMSQAGSSSITDASLLLPGAPSRMTLVADARHADGTRAALLPSEHHEETLPSGDRRFHKPLLRAVGTFQTGDTLQVVLDADYRTDPSRDLVHVQRPSRFVLFRVAPDTTPESMTEGTLRTFAVGDGLGDLTEAAPPVRVEPRVGDDGLPTLEHVVRFPTPDTLYVFEWEVSFDA